MSQPRHPRQSLSFRGLILNTIKAKEDMVVRAISEEGQLIPMISLRARAQGRKGSRKSRLQPISLVHLDCSLRERDEQLEARLFEDLARVDEAFIENPFSAIKLDLTKTALAMAMAEVVLHLVPDWAFEPELYELLNKALIHLERPQTQPSEELYLLFIVRSLDSQGVLGDLDEFVELPESSRLTLQGWREGQWQRLEPATLPLVGRFLEGQVSQISNRPLLARALLELALSPNS